jgi:8-oxo-dGTP diphosphatase
MDTGLGVKALILKGHDILILVKHSGVLDLPGGKVELGETRKEALGREITEETGLITRIQDPICHWSITKSDGLQIIGVTYLCQYAGGRVSLSNEHSNYFWCPRKKIQRANSRSGWMNASRMEKRGFARFVFSDTIAMEN